MIGVIRNGVVLNTATMALVGERSVVVENDKIVDLVTGPASVEADFEIDAGGQFVLPGFIDSHVHHFIVTMNFSRLHAMSEVERGIGMARLAEGMVARGFTTVRDTGGDLRGLIQAIASGACGGPRIVQAGRLLSQTGGHGDFRPGSVPVAECGCQIHSDHASFVVDGVDSVRKAARQALRDGSQFIKIMTSGGVASPTDPFDSVQFTAEEVRAITTETDHRRTYTTSHAYLPEAISLAIENGVACIEHGNAIDAPTAERMAELGAVMVPTLVTYKAMQEAGAKMGLPQTNLDKNAGVFEMGLRSIEIARAAGVELGFGTDLLGETQTWQRQEFAIRADLEPAQDVLRSMYTTGAKLCSLEGQVGTLEPGAFADIVITPVDPVDNLAGLADIDAITTVIQHGQPVH